MIWQTKVFTWVLNIIRYMSYGFLIVFFFLLTYSLGFIMGTIITIIFFPLYFLFIILKVDDLFTWVFNQEEYFYSETTNSKESFRDSLKYSKLYLAYAKFYDFLFIDNERARFLIFLHLKKYWAVYFFISVPMIFFIVIGIVLI